MQKVWNVKKYDDEYVKKMKNVYLNILDYIENEKRSIIWSFLTQNLLEFLQFEDYGNG